MSLLIGLKIFGDICLYFSALSAFPELFTYGASFFWPALLCGVGTGLAVSLEFGGKSGLRLCGVLIPCLSLLFAREVMEMVILLPAILYVAVIVVRGVFNLEYYACRQLFVKSAVIWGVFFLIVFLLDTVMQKQEIELEYGGVLIYGLVYGLAEVFLLRQLRLGEDGRRREKINTGIELGTVLGGIGGVMLTFTGVGYLLRRLGVFESIRQMVAVLLGAPGDLINKGIVYVTDLIEGDAPQMNQQYGENTGGVGGFLGMFAELIPSRLPEEETAGAGFPWWLVVTVFAVLFIGLFVMMKLFKKKSGIVVRRMPGEQLSEVEHRKREKSETNREKVRRYYRDFIKIEQRMGLKRKGNQTSQDILELISAQTERTAAETLREVYLPARYDLQSEVSREQVKLAKMALEKCHRSESVK